MGLIHPVDWHEQKAEEILFPDGIRTGTSDFWLASLHNHVSQFLKISHPLCHTYVLPVDSAAFSSGSYMTFLTTASWVEARACARGYKKAKTGRERKSKFFFFLAFYLFIYFLLVGG